MIAVGSGLPPANAAPPGLPPPPPPGLAATRADQPCALLVGEQVGRAGAQAVTGGAAAGAVEELLTRGDELLRRDVGAEREGLRHLGLQLRDLVGDQGIQRQRAEDHAHDLKVSGPHGPLLCPPARRSTSPPAPRPRTRPRRATGRSARTA